MSQVQIDAVSVKEGSHEIRVWEGDGLVADESPYTFVCVLRNLGNNECEYALAMGDMSNDVNIAIAIKAIELGYKTLKFYKLKGGKVSRWAQYTHSDNIYEYYTIDLVSSYNHYLKYGTI